MFFIKNGHCCFDSAHILNLYDAPFGFYSCTADELCIPQGKEHRGLLEIIASYGNSVQFGQRVSA
jgi:hypothetical protein